MANGRGCGTVFRLEMSGNETVLWSPIVVWIFGRARIVDKEVRFKRCIDGLEGTRRLFELEEGSQVGAGPQN
jgi:hypothetical protein